MKNHQFKVGQKINYANGSNSIYVGTIVKIKKNTVIVIDCEAGLQLWNAGFNVGSEIAFNQVK
jgi:hypothetical protein